MKCSNCGAESDGAFCSQCGSPLKGAHCRECKAALIAGARFCTNCGTSVSGSGEAGKLPWIVAGTAVTALIIALAWPALRGGDGDRQTDGRIPIEQMQTDLGTGQSPSGTPPALTGTPREQADRLFNRIMSEREAGDTARAKFFLPMALQAYENAAPLDEDGYYHLSLLQSFGGNYSAAQSTAEKILTTAPNHLLGLGAAASAARSNGDDASARRYYQRLLAAYATESRKPLKEYQDHAGILPQLKEQAEAFRR